ncbi:MAG: hypothetical protein AAF809_08915, partial [Bacteroidota bacterium]
ENERILAWVESIGGGYVWEEEILAVTLLEADIDDSQAERLAGLVGVDQIALRAECLSMSALSLLAQIAGLKSLVLADALITDSQREELAAIGPEIKVVAVL